MIKPAAHIGAMAPYALADLGGPDTVSMAQNESAFPASPLALKAGQAALQDMPLYPDPDWPDLRAAIAEVHGLDPAQILCGAGSMELIGALIRAYGGPQADVLGTEFGYAYVSSAAAQVQARYVTVAEEDFAVSTAALSAAITPQTRIVFLCNPGNPTGTLISNAEILTLHAKLPDGCLLVVDQAYGEFADEIEPPHALFEAVATGNICILRTFSKAYGLAGARVGWGYFPAEIASELRKVLNPNNVSIPAQAMAAAAMRDQDYMRSVVAQTAAIREEFCAACQRLGVSVPQSHTNFALLVFDDAGMAQKADKALRQNNILMRGMAGYGLPQAMRATICARPEMARALDVLTEVLT